jgi:hypothetical protein
VKEVTMTRRVRLWITAMLSIVVAALMAGPTVAAQADPEAVGVASG